MIYTTETKKAIKLAFKAHEGQFDKSGLPYVLHPIHLAEQMEDEDTTVAALLHDVVEDSAMTFDDLIKEGFNEEIINALRLLTHKEDVPYMEYVKDIKKNETAKKVKLADLKHNSDLSRLDVVDDWALKRNDKYQEAIHFLEK